MLGATLIDVDGAEVRSERETEHMEMLVIALVAPSPPHTNTMRSPRRGIIRCAQPVCWEWKWELEGHPSP